MLSTDLNLGKSAFWGILARLIGKKIRTGTISYLSLLFFYFLLLTSCFLLPTTIFASDGNPPTSSAANGDEERSIIKTIEVQGLSRMKNEELIDMICVKAGDIIDRDNLRKGIKRAFKKGIFLDIQAVTEPYEDGVKLLYIVRELPLVKSITIKGNKGISEREIKKQFFFKKGGNFREGFLERASSELMHFYNRKGFPEAKVKIDIKKDIQQNSVDINLLIEEGQPLIIKRIDILPDAKGIIYISEGDILDRSLVERDIKRLRDYYKKQGYFNPLIGPYEFKEGQLTIPIIKGPRLEIAFQGNDTFSAKELLKEVTFFEEERVDSEIIQEIANRIRGFYLGRGYYHMQIVPALEKGDDIFKITFFIFEGERVILKEVRFEGANIGLDSIKAVIPLKEGEPFSDELLNMSSESIVSLYHALGYIHVDIKEIIKDFSEDVREVVITFVIDEGAVVSIKEISITGNEVINTADIINMLSLKEGDPYNETDVEDARHRILSLYNKIGYVNASVDVEISMDGDRATVDFKITEDKPFVFGKTIIRGNEKTKDKIIRRELLFKEGEPYNYEAILKTRQSLYKLGLFTDIAISQLETEEVKEGVYTQDVIIDLKEGNPGSLEIGLGYGDYEQFRSFLDINYRNLSGYNRQVGFRTEFSSIKSRYILHFREPWFLNKPLLPLNISLTNEHIKSINIDTKDVLYKVNRISLLAGLEREFTKQLKGGLNYEYSLVETTDVQPGVILSKEDIGSLGISSISTSLFYDTRDNPFDPSAGSIKGVILKLATDVIFSETEFIKAIAQSSWYLKIIKGMVFALSLKGGVAHGIGDTIELPIIERFFLGGRTTIRGFSQDTVGPKSEGDNPMGGNVFALINTEMRLSLGKGLGMVAFMDSGNVWQRIEDVSSKLRYTAGMGLRYNTPAGPIRLDYGHKLDRKDGESTGELHFSLGHAF